MSLNIYLITDLIGPAIRPKGRYLYMIEAQGKNGESITRTGHGTVKNTNEHRLTLRALVKALRRFKASEVNIYSDCSYLISNYKYLERWQQADWQIKGKYIKNLPSWIEIYVRNEGRKVTFHPLKGSSYESWMEYELRKL